MTTEIETDRSNGTTETPPEETGKERKRRALPSADPTDLTLIGLDTDDKEEHPLYDPRVHNKPDKSMMQNIKTLGILNPIHVQENGDLLEVVAGRQRVINARAANIELAKLGEPLIKVPYRVVHVDEATAMGISFSENTQRKDDDVLIKAKKVQRYMAHDGSSGAVEAAANYFKVTPATIGVWLKINDVHPDVRQAIQDGSIKATAAGKLADLPKDEQVQELQKILGKGVTPTIAEVEATVKAKKKAKKAPEGEEEDVLRPLTIGKLRRLHRYWMSEDCEATVSDEAMQMVRVIIADISPKKVKGLLKSMQAAGLLGEEEEEE